MVGMIVGIYDEDSLPLPSSNSSEKSSRSGAVKSSVHNQRCTISNHQSLIGAIGLEGLVSVSNEGATSIS